MIDKIIGAVLGFALCKALGLIESHGGLTGLFHMTSSTGPAPAALPVASHTPQGGMLPGYPPGGLQVTSTAAPFTTAVPAGLPPWPGGWKPARTTQDVIARAQVFMSSLAVGGSAIERASDGRWIRYQKSKQGTKTMVTAWEPKEPVAAMAAPSGIPGSPTVVPASYTTPAASPSGAMPPTLRKGMKGQPVRELQSLLGLKQDGDFQSGTEAAVKAFQKSHGLTPDGIAGPNFWRAARGSYAQA